MAIELRRATEEDLPFLTEALHKTFLYLMAQGKDPYCKGFGALSVEEMETYLLEYLDERKARTFILQNAREEIGCIMGKIAPSHLSASGLGLVGWIGLCYVDARFRRADHCVRMYEQLQAWFGSMAIDIIELSYMASNLAAQATWEKLGFEPFRVIAYKKIDPAEEA
ncbi:GNAT family N-acetyltransferase [Sulfurimonas diazotrophicus]|uniref:GNAT family N-acetyltransferase n=1 Tax=Sulfurimonas diazotrophicus TaxID=3131939 RepID=A0ABZ3HCL9_9BACT